jgi:hypothetical protein
MEYHNYSNMEYKECDGKYTPVMAWLNFRVFDPELKRPLEDEVSLNGYSNRFQKYQLCKLSMKYYESAGKALCKK